MVHLKYFEIFSNFFKRENQKLRSNTIIELYFILKWLSPKSQLKDHFNLDKNHKLLSEPSYESSTSESDSTESSETPTKSDTNTKSSDSKSRDISRDYHVGTGNETGTTCKQLKPSKEIIKTSTPSRLHLKKGYFSFIENDSFIRKMLIDNSEKSYKNKIDDENRYQKQHPTAEHAKTDDSESSNDGDNDNYVVYGYVKNERVGPDGDDSESDSNDKENDQECMK